MPRFRAILKNLSRQKELIESFARQITDPLERSQVQPTINVQYIAGHMYEHIDVTGNGQAHIGDYHGGCQSSEDSKNSILEQLASLQHLLSDTRAHIDQQEWARHEDQLTRVRDWIAGPRVAVHHERAYQIHSEYTGTGLWILKDDRLQHWLNEDLPRRPTLWMHGIPGAGLCS